MINKRKKNGWVKWLAVGLVIVVLAVFAVPTISGMISGNSNQTPTNANTATLGDQSARPASGTPTRSTSTATAKRGSLSVSVSGSGTVAPSDSRTLYSQAGGTVDAINVSVGDTVRAGEIVMQLASNDLETQIASLETTLFSAQTDLAAVRDSGSTSSIYAPAAGRVKMIKAEEGDDVAMIMKQHGYLCVISRDGKMKVEFTPPTIQGLNVGDKVNVWIKSTAVEGTVDQMTGLSGSISVTIDDDSYDVGEPVSVSTLLGEKLGDGVLEVNMPIPVTGIGGTVDTIYYEDNDKVSSGYRLFYLTGRIPSSALRSAMLTYEAARVEYDNAKTKQDGLTLRAPIDGVITEINTTEGAMLEEAVPVYSIQSSDNFEVVAAVDELDIVNVEVGQNVKVELDAYPNRTFDAIVNRISGVGVVSGGVTTYDVTVTLLENANFRDGMTANIEVVVSDSQNVILLPVEAVSTANGQSYVTLSGGATSNVTTGLSDGTNIEILSGVNEGDTVVYSRSSSSSSSSTTSNMGFRGEMGGGAMPAGGVMMGGF